MTIKQMIKQILKKYKYQKQKHISILPISRLKKSKQIDVFLFCNSVLYGFRLFKLKYYHSQGKLNLKQWEALLENEGEKTIVLKILGSINTRKGTDYKPLNYFWSFPDNVISKSDNKKSISKNINIKKSKIKR